MHHNEDENPVKKEEEQPLKDEAQNSAQNMSFWEKLEYIRSNITVEPVVVLFFMPVMIDLLTTQNLNLDKACRVNLQFDDAVCTDLSLRKRDNHTFEEVEVQKLTAMVQAWKSVIHTTIPALLILFIGAWSDKTGRRKIVMAMPILGELITSTLNMINTYFFYEVSLEWTAFMEAIFPALGGSSFAVLLGTYSYLSDITSTETRTFRLGFLGLCVMISVPIGGGLSGMLVRYTGYYGAFAISGLMKAINLFYIIFTLEDHTWLSSKGKVKKTGCAGFFAEFFDWRSLKATFQIAFKKGSNNRRLRICLILVVVCLDYGPFFGELSIMYIFARYRFNWDEVKYSIYSMYSPIARALGTTFSISVFSKKLRMDDAILGVIATLSKIAGSFVLAFARNSTEVYFVPMVQILDGTTTIALRSIASKLVTQQELGKLFSLFGLAETLMPLIFAPLYSRVYILTIHILPGAAFLLTVAATMPATGIFTWFYSRHKKDARKMKRKAINLSENSIPADAVICE